MNKMKLQIIMNKKSRFRQRNLESSRLKSVSVLSGIYKYECNMIQYSIKLLCILWKF